LCTTSWGCVTMNQPNLGQLVRDLRRAAGLTQEDLAARAGLSTRAISDLERGVNHSPRQTTVQLLAAALGLSDREREHFDAVARSHAENFANTATVPLAAREWVGPRLPGAAASTPLIGRVRELATLEQHLAGEGPPLLLIAGEPGMGKTRVLQEAAALGTRFGFNVLRGTVLSAGDPDSLDPIADALRHALQGRSPVLMRRDLQGCAPLVHILPELGSSGYAGVESAPEGMNPAVAASAVMRFVANTAGPAGTVLTLDNLHDAAAPTLALLVRLVRSSSDLPVRIVAAYRNGHCTGSDPLSSVLGRLAHEQLTRHLELSRLSTREAADLLTAAAIQRGQPIDPWPARALHDSGGVPFYLLAWAEHLDLARQQHAHAAVPWPIQQSVRFRMDAGPASVRHVLEVLAALGGRARHTVLRDVVGLPPQDLQASLEWCSGERLIEEEDQSYAFAYGVVRTAVDSDLNLTRRQAIHRRMAALGQKRTTSQVSAREDERAYHLAVLRRGRPAGAVED
jgi:transcriptional regulator with XRE-family HTH domain